MEIASDGTVSVRDGAGEAAWQVLGSPDGSDRPGEAPDAALTTLGRPDVPARYADLVERAAASANISPALLSALVWQESRWNPAAVSPKGAMGLSQLMPGTARDLGVDPRDPTQNLVGGARYLRQMLNAFDGDVEMALAAYNAGPGRVRRANGIPAIRETQNYVASIVKRTSSIPSGAHR